jgi:putative PIN family toxin of toxin-antitoxin system
LAEDRRVVVFASLDLLEEIHRVLEYEKVLRILKRSGREPSSIMTTIVSLCSLVDVRSTIRAIEEDPSDNQVLACAKDAAANFIVSGDRHLLQLEEYESIRILTASSFLDKQRFPGTQTETATR